MKNKYGLGEYVVHSGIVCVVRIVWTSPQLFYDLSRVFPYEMFYKEKIHQDHLTKWDGTQKTTEYYKQ